MNSEIPNAVIDGVPNTKIHIQNIPPHFTDVQLKQILAQAGSIKDMCYFNKSKKQMNNYQNKKIYNTALVTFSTHEEALNVIQNIKTLVDCTDEEREIDAKFAIPNLNSWNANNNNNNNANNNNVNTHASGNNYGSFQMHYQNHFQEGNIQNGNAMNTFNGQNMNNYNFMNRGKAKGMNTMMNMNMGSLNNGGIVNANGMEVPNNMVGPNPMMYNSFSKTSSDVRVDHDANNISQGKPNISLSNSNSNSNMMMYSTSEHAYDENENNLDGLSLWESYKDSNNNIYYYNNLTKHTQWKKPIHPNKLFQSNLAPDKPKQNGPNGSNLFIFHIPSEWTDADLFQHFCCFGNVISSKIQRDSTGRNSGFGFVSYDNATSAHYAIQFMNGYAVNNKYLKVQLKKGEVPVQES